MASLINEPDEEDKQASEQKNQEELDHAKELVDEARSKQGHVDKEQYIQILVPVNQLLAANRKQRKEFYTNTIKQIKGKLEIIHIERSLKNGNTSDH